MLLVDRTGMDRTLLKVDINSCNGRFASLNSLLAILLLEDT
jgi:hypothetical protein